jgi:hypothetical protein
VAALKLNRRETITLFVAAAIAALYGFLIGPQPGM